MKGFFAQILFFSRLSRRFLTQISRFLGSKNLVTLIPAIFIPSDWCLQISSLSANFGFQSFVIAKLPQSYVRCSPQIRNWTLVGKKSSKFCAMFEKSKTLLWLLFTDKGWGAVLGPKDHKFWFFEVGPKNSFQTEHKPKIICCRSIFSAVGPNFILISV